MDECIDAQVQICRYRSNLKHLQLVAPVQLNATEQSLHPVRARLGLFNTIPRVRNLHQSEEVLGTFLRFRIG